MVPALLAKSPLGVEKIASIASLQRILRENESGGKGQKLLDILVQNRHTESKDPRDKCLAFVGLTSDMDIFQDINPYKESTSTVYRLTTQAIALNTSNNESPLNFLRHADRPRKRIDLLS